MASLRLHNTKLIDQALMVSHELVRMAILWQEEWHESLEEASKQYFGDGNIQAMLDTLAPLHQAVEEGPVTLKEMSFCQAYGHDLKDAWDSIKSYRRYVSFPVPVASYLLNTSQVNLCLLILPHL
jgi:FKBP12-rapamycin complex-associated protein